MERGAGSKDWEVRGEEQEGQGRVEVEEEEGAEAKREWMQSVHRQRPQQDEYSSCRRGLVSVVVPH